MKTDRELLQELYDVAKAALEEAESCPDDAGCDPECEASAILTGASASATEALGGSIFREVEARLFGLEPKL